MPEISLPIPFNEVLDQSNHFDLKLAFWEEDTTRVNDLRNFTDKNFKNIIILIVPEGGFSKSEIELAKEHNFYSYSLGPRILRAQTASIAACTLIQNIFGDI